MRTSIWQIAILIALVFGVAARPALAQDTFNWDDPNGGVYGVFNNWSPLGTPNEVDTARFLLDSTYAVSFFQNQQAAEFHVFDGNITFESGGTGGGNRAYVVELATVAINSELHIRRGADDKNLTVSTSDLFTNRGTVGVAGGAELINTDASVDSLGGSSVAQLQVAGTSPTGVRSLWEATDAVVGDDNNGSVQIEDGGFADINGPVVVGASAGSDGEITVTGRNANNAQSALDVFSNMTIGDAGTGRLLIRDGSRVDSNDVYLGNSLGGRGTLTVEGGLASGSARLVAGGLFAYRGDVFINRGGSMSATNALIGNGATSSVTVTGAGVAGDPGRWIALGTTTLGDNAEMILNINEGGVVDASSLFVGQQVGGLGRINLSSTNPAERSQFLASDFVFLGGNSLGPGGLAELTLNQNSTAIFRDTTTIYLGSSVTLNSPSSHLIADAIFNAQGGVLNFLSGTLNTQNYTGDLLNQGGTLSPFELGSSDGTGTGLTTIDGDYTQQSGATLAIDIKGSLCGVSYDHVSVTGNATLGGMLELTLLDGFAPQANDTFDILSSNNLLGQFANAAPGSRLTTTDGLGSFVVNYGVTSPFDGDMVILSDFLFNIDLPGDYNNDGTVNAADYAAWRDALGTSVTLPGDATPGSVTQADYDVWRNNFGTAAAIGTSTTTTAAVPEPTSACLAGAIGVLLLLARCRRVAHFPPVA